MADLCCGGLSFRFAFLCAILHDRKEILLLERAATKAAARSRHTALTLGVSNSATSSLFICGTMLLVSRFSTFQASFPSLLVLTGTFRKGRALDGPINQVKIKLFSFFSGAGFLDLGFETEGFRVAFVNEYCPAFLEAYRHSRRLLNIESPEYGYYAGSITNLSTDVTLRRKLGERVQDSRRNGTLVGFIGGPPCPDFSVGGKNRGKEGENGKLSLAYIDLICEQLPDFFLFENVKGLWLTKRHRRFYEELKVKLWNAGFKTTERLINSIEYGVPQDRERIILLGFRDTVARCVGHTFDSLSNGFFPWMKFLRYRADEIFSLPWPTAAPFEEDGYRPFPIGVPEDLTVGYWFERNNVATHANAEDCFKPRAGLARFQSVPEGDDSKKSFKRLHRWRYSPTACYGNNEVHLHPFRPRRISVAEALAVQSLPGRFQLPPGMTLSMMFKTVGNGVPYLAANGIARTIHYFLQAKYDETDSVRHSTIDQETAEEQSLQLY